MEKREKGYHCKSCDHVLTDFRNSSNEEIQTVLQASPGKICGIFYPSQFDYKVSHVQLPAFKAVGLSLLGILGFLGPVITSCDSNPAATEHKQKAFNQLKFPMHLTGKVNDEKTGKPLPFFEVEILQHGRLIKTVKTDKDGNFDILINEKDLDEEVFKLAIGRNGSKKNTITSNLSKFRNKKVKLTIQASLAKTLPVPGYVEPKVINCSAIEGEIIPPEPLGGVPAMPPEPTPGIPFEAPSKPVNEVVGVVVQSEPEFPGGPEAMRQYLIKNLVYPAEALKNEIGGKVYLRFQIEEDGNISNVKVQRGITDCPNCDAEAVRVVKAMPKWKPAENDGKPIKSWFNLPIKFNP